MTREEAIKILKAIRVYECYPKSASEETKEAIDMAIEALNSVTDSENGAVESKNDVIKRQDAIKTVIRMCSPICDGELEEKAYTDCVIDEINSLPSAEAVQRWIPVEEQPPVFPCLVCDANGNQPSVPLGIVTITDEEHGEWHIDGRLWDTKIFFKGEWCSQTGYGNRIIAWMPLPKPYKAGDSE